jgi:hypothetical protein
MLTFNPALAILEKTALGKETIQSRSGDLCAIERRVLLLINGSRTLAQLQSLLSVEVSTAAARLLVQGMVQPVAHAAQTPLAPEFAAVFEASAPPKGSPKDTDRFATLPSPLRIHCAQSDSGADVRGPHLTVPGELTHRSASLAGLSGAKAYLAEVLENHLSDPEGRLAQQVSRIDSEADAYYALEHVCQALSKLVSNAVLSNVMRRFDLVISQR